MRKIISLSLLLVLGLTAVAQAAADADTKDVLARLKQYIAKMGRYEAAFALQAGDYKAEGRYLVDGDTYHIVVGDIAEVYCDGKVRYEVDNEREEVNIDVVDASSRNILDNPTRCFDFVGEDYTAEIIRKDDKETTLRLVARDKDMEGEILLTLQTSTGKPLKISYLLYDDRIDVVIKSLAPRKTKLRTFSKGDYKGYDMVDFR